MKFFVLVLITIAVFVGSTDAQTVETQVTGTVTDDSGAVISNADVRLVNSQQILLGAVKTDANGRYIFGDVPDGSYVVTASRRDFSSQSQTVQVDDEASMQIDLV